jgi:hypothetical protein
MRAAFCVLVLAFLPAVAFKMRETTLSMLPSGSQTPAPANMQEKLVEFRNYLADKWHRRHTCHLFGEGIYNDLRAGERANALVTNPCLTPHVIGNRIATYFEFYICAQVLGLNYVAVKLVEAGVGNETQAFFQALPDIKLNSLKTSWSYPALQQIKAKCPCSAFCHDKKDALIFEHIHIPSMLFRNAIDAYWADRIQRAGTLLYQVMAVNASGVSVYINDMNNELTNKAALELKLPAIPDVAIQYRVSNVLFVSQYGFISYWAITDRIPANVSTIYILSDSPMRNEIGLDNPEMYKKKMMFWLPILEGLLAFVKNRFPSATVLLLRGQDIMDDMARLALADVTICSASTYCFWPAIASRTQSYFPKTSLINHGLTRNISANFNWMLEDYILGLDVNITEGPAALVRKLSKRASRA